MLPLYLVPGDERPRLIIRETLFPGGPGNTFGSAENHARIMDGLAERIFGALPDETWVYPGHDDDPPSEPSGRRCRSGANVAGQAGR